MNVGRNFTDIVLYLKHVHTSREEIKAYHTLQDNTEIIAPEAAKHHLMWPHREADVNKKDRGVGRQLALMLINKSRGINKSGREHGQRHPQPHSTGEGDISVIWL